MIACAVEDVECDGAILDDEGAVGFDDAVDADVTKHTLAAKLLEEMMDQQEDEHGHCLRKISHLGMSCSFLSFVHGRAIQQSTHRKLEESNDRANE